MLDVSRAGLTPGTLAPLFEILAAYHLAHPGVAITVVEDRSERLIDRVRLGTADLALIGLAGGPPDDLQSLPIASGCLVVATPPHHLLAVRHHTTL